MMGCPPGSCPGKKADDHPGLALGIGNLGLALGFLPCNNLGLALGIALGMGISVDLGI